MSYRRSCKKWFCFMKDIPIKFLCMCPNGMSFCVFIHTCLTLWLNATFLWNIHSQTMHILNCIYKKMKVLFMFYERHSKKSNLYVSEWNLNTHVLDTVTYVHFLWKIHINYPECGKMNIWVHRDKADNLPSTTKVFFWYGSMYQSALT